MLNKESTSRNNPHPNKIIPQPWGISLYRNTRG